MQQNLTIIFALFFLAFIEQQQAKEDVTKGHMIACENACWQKFEERCPYQENCNFTQNIRDDCDITKDNSYNNFSDDSVVPEYLVNRFLQCKNNQYYSEYYYPAYLAYTCHRSCIYTVQDKGDLPHTLKQEKFILQNFNECEEYCEFMFEREGCDSQYDTCEKGDETSNECEQYKQNIDGKGANFEITYEFQLQYQQCQNGLYYGAPYKINQLYKCQVQCTNSLINNYDFPSRYYSVYLVEKFTYAGYDQTEVEQCYEECNEKCGKQCNKELAFQLQLNSNRCLPEYNTISIGSSEQDLLNRQSCYQNIENQNQKSVGIYTKQNAYCKRINCLEKYLTTPEKAEQYDNDKYIGTYEKASNQFMKTKETEGLGECEQKCDQDCDQDCTEETAHNFDTDSCNTLEDKQNLTAEDFLNGTRLYQDCINQNLEQNFEKNSSSSKNLECKNQCVDSEVIKIKEKVASDCSGTTCYKKVLFCLDECEQQKCNGFNCMGSDMKNQYQNVFKYLTSTCEGLGEELQKQNEEQIISNQDVPLRTAAELISCSRSQAIYFSDNTFVDDYKQVQNMFQCTKLCAAKQSSLYLSFSLILLISSLLIIM